MVKSNFEEMRALIQSRRSMRDFLDKPVPQDDLESVFECASYAPSNCNTQPWKVVVATGERANTLKQALVDHVGQGHMQLDFPFSPDTYTEVQKQRFQAAGALMYDAAGIARDDRNGRDEFIINNLKFFGAPHAAFFFMPQAAGVREAADIGMYAQNVMLAMSAKGIGSCPQTILSFNADVVRECLGVEKDFKLLFGLSFGYFDPDKPLNQVRTARAPVTASVDFV